MLRMIIHAQLGAREDTRAQHGGEDGAVHACYTASVEDGGDVMPQGARGAEGLHPDFKL